MLFNIEDVRDIAKLLGAIRLMAKGEFKVEKELLDNVLTRLHHAAKERGIAIKIVSPSGERIVEFTANGVIVGAVVGFYIGQIPGSAGKQRSRYIPYRVKKLGRGLAPATRN